MGQSNVQEGAYIRQKDPYMHIESWDVTNRPIRDLLVCVVPTDLSGPVH